MRVAVPENEGQKDSGTNVPGTCGEVWPTLVYQAHDGKIYCQPAACINEIETCDCTQAAAASQNDQRDEDADEIVGEAIKVVRCGNMADFALDAKHSHFVGAIYELAVGRNRRPYILGPHGAWNVRRVSRPGL